MNSEIQTPIEVAFDAVADQYDALFRDEDSQTEDAVVSAALEALIDAKPEGPVLDLGCGTGHVLSLAPFLAQEYVGVDLSQRMVEKARENWPEYRFGRAEMCDHARLMPRGSVSAVVSTFTTINHLPWFDRGALWIDLGRALKRDGRLLFVVATKERLASPRYIFANGPEVFAEPISHSEIMEFAMIGGFEIEVLIDFGPNSPEFTLVRARKEGV